MKKAGGIISLIAGILVVIAAVVTMFLGGVGAAFGGEGAETVFGLGWLGILFSFLTIIFGGTSVAVFMVLALIGVIFAAIGTKKVEEKTQEAKEA